MLKKISFGLVLFILVSFSVDSFIENFERPWNYEYKWPNNVSVVDYTLTFGGGISPSWNVYVLQNSVDRLSIPIIATPYSQTTKIINAKRSYTETKNIFVQIDEFTNKGIYPLFIDPTQICNFFNVTDTTNCMCIFTRDVLECTGVNREFRYLLAKRIFSSDYAAAWKGSMNNSLDALENASSALNKALYTLEKDYINIAFSGACEHDVAGYEACENVSLFFAALNNSNIIDYADFRKIKFALENNYIKVYDDVPLLEFGWIINSIGDEKDSNTAIGKIKLLNSILNAHNETLKRRYIALLNEANALIDEASNLDKIVDEQQLRKIYVSSLFKDIAGGDTASVTEKISNGKLFLALAYANMSNSKITMSYQESGYLRAVIADLSNAKILARTSKNEFSTAINNAKEIVSSYEKKASEWISKTDDKFVDRTIPERARVFYELAKKSFNDGRNADKIGNKFEYYVYAIKNAKSAYAISPENEKDTNWSSIASCLEAEDLMKKAKIDGIDIITETALYSVLNKSKNVSEFISGCNYIKETIIASAQHEYSGLNELRSEASKFIVLCGTDCDDLKTDLKIIETGIALNGEIVYPDSIGSLKILQNRYVEIKNKAIISIKLQLEKYLFVRKTFFAENAVLDRPSNVRFEISVTNTVEYPGKNLKINVESPVDFSQDDLVCGTEDLSGVVYLNGKLSMYINTINASEKKLFAFEKNRTLLRTEKIMKKAFGAEDYSARINENRDVVCVIGIDGFYVSEKWIELKIDDGLVVLNNGFVKKHVSEGTHRFEARYDIKDAYSKQITESNGIKAGERVYYKYIIELTPNMGMEYLQTFAPIPQNDYVKERKAITVSGEKIETIENVGGFTLRVFGLIQSKKASVIVSYYIDNSTEYAKQEINKLEKLNLSNDSKIIVNEAKTALLQNDTQTAVEKIQKTYEHIERERIDTTKLQKEYQMRYVLISKELQEIENVVVNNENNDFANIIEIRRNFLNGVLNGLTGKTLSEQVSLLKTYDEKWMSTRLQIFKKNASVKINTMYARYLEIGNNDTELAIEFASLRSLYRKFDTSALLEDGYALASVIERTTIKMDALEKRITAETTTLVSNIEVVRKEFIELLKKYNSEYSDAKGSRFENLFKIKNEDARVVLKQIDSVLKNGNSSTISKTHQKLIGLDRNISTTLDYLNWRANNDSIHVKEMVSVFSKRLPEKEHKKITSLTTAMDNYLNNKEWVKTLKTHDEILKILSLFESGTNYDIILWLSAVFVCGVVMLYYFKGREQNGKKQKPLKKLEKAI